MIESVNNEKVKRWARLKDKKYQEQDGRFVIEGLHLVEEARKAGALEEVIATIEVEDFKEITTLVSEEVMKKITALTNPPKIIGVAKKIEGRDIFGTVLLLDGVGDPGNLGTIIRSAVAFSVDTIVLGDNTVSIYNPKVVRATEGLIFHINIVERSLLGVIPKLKEEGYSVYSTDVTGGKPLKNIEFNEKTAIVIGSEAKGVSREVRNLKSERLYIPMNEASESLNVGVATSIILYELYSKRN